MGALAIKSKPRLRVYLFDNGETPISLSLTAEKLRTILYIKTKYIYTTLAIKLLCKNSLVGLSTHMYCHTSHMHSCSSV